MSSIRISETEKELIKWARDKKYKYIFRSNELIVVSSNLPDDDGVNYKIGEGASCTFMKKTDDFSFISTRDIHLLKNLLENDVNPICIS